MHTQTQCTYATLILYCQLKLFCCRTTRDLTGFCGSFTWSPPQLPRCGVHSRTFQHGHKPGFTNHWLHFSMFQHSSTARIFWSLCLVGLTLTTHDMMHHCQRATLPFFFFFFTYQNASFVRTNKVSNTGSETCVNLNALRFNGLSSGQSISTMEIRIEFPQENLKVPTQSMLVQRSIWVPEIFHYTT